VAAAHGASTQASPAPRPALRAAVPRQARALTIQRLGDRESYNFAGPRLRISNGAHNYAYSEFLSFGNPGGYQSFVLTASDVAPGVWGNGMAAAEELGDSDWPNEHDRRAWDSLPIMQEFRRTTVVTTYTAISMDLWVDNFPTSFAPPISVVRTLP